MPAPPLKEAADYFGARQLMDSPWQPLSRQRLWRDESFQLVPVLSYQTDSLYLKTHTLNHEVNLI